MKSLVFDIRTLPEGKTIIELMIGPEEFKWDLFEDNLPEPVRVVAEIERNEFGFAVKASGTGRYHYSCSRCLDDFEVPFEIVYKSYRRLQDVEKAGGILDIGMNLREEIILGVENRPLCSPDCKGLCSGCGANLNREQCTCILK